MEQIVKWCNILSFPDDWREIILQEAKNFNVKAVPETPMGNLLKVLYDCEDLSARYAKIGINEKILIDTLNDIVVWVRNHFVVNGEVGLSEMDWIELHMNMELFRIGRLHFRFGKCICSSERLGLNKDDPIIEIHIPQGEALDNEACRESFREAVKFFDEFFPEFKYQYFTCHSWLLDFNIASFLKPTSNILKFSSNFDIIFYDESDSAVKRLFTLNSQKENGSSLQRNVRQHLDNGGKLFAGFGVIDKKDFMD